ncbi:hypothetical protein KIPB_007705 [Kipferlia bialata]|uniref:Uncharacterized protein n=1 Tax=Kipferlia bialata TaxID=797122 RepID=A0A9K3GKR0_9EUKA|nr:hypothetical protein KIPB_007705 [Kipferlia bialata]|eukprot:g7705.t1
MEEEQSYTGSIIDGLRQELSAMTLRFHEADLQRTSARLDLERLRGAGDVAMDGGCSSESMETERQEWTEQLRLAREEAALAVERERAEGEERVRETQAAMLRDIEDMGRERGEALAALSEAEAEVASLLGAREEASASEADRAAEVADLTSRLSHAESTLQSVREGLEGAQGEVAMAGQEMASLLSQVDTLTQERQGLEAKVEELGADLDVAKVEAEAVVEERDGLVEEKTRLEAQIERLSSVLAAEEARHHTDREAEGERESEREVELQSHIASLESRLEAALEAQIAEAGARERERAEHAEAVAELRAEVAEEHKRVVAAYAALTDTKSELSSTYAELTDTKSDLASADASISHLKGVAEDAQAQLERERAKGAERDEMVRALRLHVGQLKDELRGHQEMSRRALSHSFLGTPRSTQMKRAAQESTRAGMGALPGSPSRTPSATLPRARSRQGKRSAFIVSHSLSPDREAPSKASAPAVTNNPETVDMSMSGMSKAESEGESESESEEEPVESSPPPSPSPQVVVRKRGRPRRTRVIESESESEEEEEEEAPVVRRGPRGTRSRAAPSRTRPVRRKSRVPVVESSSSEEEEEEEEEEYQEEMIIPDPTPRPTRRGRQKKNEYKPRPARPVVRRESKRKAAITAKRNMVKSLAKKGGDGSESGSDYEEESLADSRVLGAGHFTPQHPTPSAEMLSIRGASRARARRGVRSPDEVPSQAEHDRRRHRRPLF